MPNRYSHTPECPEVVVAHTVHHIKVSTGSAGYRLVPTITHSAINVSLVEHFKAQVQLEQVL